MRMAQWTLILSGMMFVASIWFVLAGARNAATATPVIAGESLASIKQIMDGIVAPASTTVYESVSIIVDEKGITENYPRTEEEWDVVSASAVALAEAGNLLMVGKRVVDEDRWPKLVQAMMDASLISMKAADSRDRDALLASGEALNDSCDNCHRTYNIDE
jgi:hypothetical protein